MVVHIASSILAEKRFDIFQNATLLLGQFIMIQNYRGVTGNFSIILSFIEFCRQHKS